MAATDTLTCTRCSTDWQRPRVRGVKPQLCPDCKSIIRTVTRRRHSPPPAGDTRHRIDPNSPGYRLGHAVTLYRLAIEEATSALRLNRPAEALAALQRVQAPGRLKG